MAPKWKLLFVVTKNQMVLFIILKYIKNPFMFDVFFFFFVFFKACFSPPFFDGKIQAELSCQSLASLVDQPLGSGDHLDRYWRRIGKLNCHWIWGMPWDMPGVFFWVESCWIMLNNVESCWIMLILGYAFELVRSQSFNLSIAALVEYLHSMSCYLPVRNPPFVWGFCSSIILCHAI